MSGSESRKNEGPNEDAGSDASSFANILNAVNRMRQEAGGERGERVDTTATKEKDLPARTLPPARGDSGGKGGTLPPRVRRPEMASEAKNASAERSSSGGTNAVGISRPVVPAKRPYEPSGGGRAASAGRNLQTFSQIQVSRSQTGNPILDYLTIYQMNSKIKDVDYVVNSKCVAIFLSLRYHKLHPEYIYNKLKKVTYNHDDTLRVLLVSVDIDDFQDTLRELNKLALFNRLTVVLAWGNEQCATYLKNLKYVEREASKKIIQGTRSGDDEVMVNEGKFVERVVDTVSSVKSISQSDAKSLFSTFHNVKGVIQADADELLNIEGLGRLKVERLVDAFNKPFVNHT